MAALNAATGQLDWSHGTGAQAYSSSAVANGVVYVGSNDDSVYAFESRRWKQRSSTAEPATLHRDDRLTPFASAR